MMEFIVGGYSLFAKGGLVMYPLLACSVAVVAIFIERCTYLRAAQTDITALLPALADQLASGDWPQAARLCAEAEGAIAALLAQALGNPVHDRQQLEQLLEAGAARLVVRLRYRLNFLDTIVTLAPLLGLLGTVTGMIQSFSVLTIKAGQPLAITGGVGEALVATAAGLCVAIVALAAHSYLAHRVEAIVAAVEEAANAVVTAAMRGWQHETR
jgi:biopolymer transport protein ExbB